MTGTVSDRRDQAADCYRQAGSPHPGWPEEAAAWRDVAWRALAVVRTTHGEPWPCWACWNDAGPTAPCGHDTWHQAPPPVTVAR